MNFELIIFDWDGTLMDSEARIVDSMQDAFGDLGMPSPTPEQIRDIIGLGLREAVHTLLPEQDEGTRSALVGRYRARYLDAEGTPTPLFPGAYAVVDELFRRGYLLAVATGKGRRGLEQALRRSGLAPLFHSTRCPDEAHSKPHPDMLEQIMDELGVPPGKTLMVGDTAYDMQLARNAHVHALAVCYGVHERERLMAYGPLDCVADIRDIPAWLTARNSG
jgi:phosphoglycolate phosphatase